MMAVVASEHPASAQVGCYVKSFRETKALKPLFVALLYSYTNFIEM